MYSLLIPIPQSDLQHTWSPIKNNICSNLFSSSFTNLYKIFYTLVEPMFLAPPTKISDPRTIATITRIYSFLYEQIGYFAPFQICFDFYVLHDAPMMSLNQLMVLLKHPSTSTQLISISLWSPFNFLIRIRDNLKPRITVLFIPIKVSNRCLQIL